MTNPHLTLVVPTTVIGTVGDRRNPPRRKRNAEVRAREYLTDAEVNRLVVAAGKNRHAHRDATIVRIELLAPMLLIIVGRQHLSDRMS